VHPDIHSAVLDPSELPDAVLIQLYQQTRLSSVVEELLTRHYPSVRHIIVKESKRTRLGQADCEDAQQEGVFAFWLALAKFDRAIADRPYGSFAAFLRIVVTARFRSYVRRLQRFEGHYDRRVRPEELSEALNGIPFGFADSSEPIVQLTWQEFSSRLEQSIGGLNPPARQLWDELASGRSLRAATESLGMSYGQGKRLRKRVIGELAERLSEWRD
jgi:RNA polymerase sigma factor (sigma-70 family)